MHGVFGGGDFGDAGRILLLRGKRVSSRWRLFIIISSFRLARSQGDRAVLIISRFAMVGLATLKLASGWAGLVGDG